jgi:hypothetical protein
MDLFNMPQISFLVFRKHLKKFLVLPALPSNENNSFNYYNSLNKGPNLAFFSFAESPSKSLLTIKFEKKSYHMFLPQQPVQNNNGQNLATQEL